MESRFAHDFSRVRVHNDARAADAAQSVAANAFTVGRDVFFAENRYEPQTEAGQKLLAHELTHVVQQSGSHDARVQRDVLADIGAFFGTSEGSFNKDELLAYLNLLRRKRDIENGYDSDNKARVVVRVWKTGDPDVVLNPELKKLLVREMWKGYTGDGDQEGILDILERSQSPDLGVIFGAGGVTPKELLGSFDGAYEVRLKAFFARRFEKDPTQGEIRPNDADPAPGQLNDATFRKKWDEKLAQGLKVLEDASSKFRADGEPKKPEEIGCKFPGSDKDPPMFDQSQWSVAEFHKNILGIYGSYVPTTKTPHEAVDGLFAHLDRWTCDCGRYVEIAWLYAWRHALGPALFDRKFVRLTFTWDDTTGMAREKVVSTESEPEADMRVFGDYGPKNEIEGYAGGGAKDLNAIWERLPVGTRVVWKNHSPVARSPWEAENAIKVSMAEHGKPARYDAHPLGPRLTEEDVKLGLASSSEDYPSPLYRITDGVLLTLSARPETPPTFLREMRKRKGERFPGKTRFKQALGELRESLQPLRDAEPEQYQQLMKALFEAARAPDDDRTPGETDEYIAKYIKRDTAYIPK